MKRFILLIVLLLGGCPGFQASLNTAAQTAPGELSELEQLKVGIVMAPISECVAVLQGVSAQLGSLKSGSPGIPVK